MKRFFGKNFWLVCEEKFMGQGGQGVRVGCGYMGWQKRYSGLKMELLVDTLLYTFCYSSLLYNLTLKKETSSLRLENEGCSDADILFQRCEARQHAARQ